MLARYIQRTSRVRYASRQAYPGLSLDPIVLRALASIRYGLPRSMATAYFDDRHPFHAGFDRLHQGDLSALDPILEMPENREEAPERLRKVVQLLRDMQAAQGRPGSWEHHAAELAYDLNPEDEKVKRINSEVVRFYNLDEIPRMMQQWLGKAGYRFLGLDPTLVEHAGTGDLAALLALRQQVFKGLVNPIMGSDPLGVYDLYTNAAYPISGAIIHHADDRNDDYDDYLTALKQSQEGVDYRPQEMLPEDYYSM